MGRGPFDSAQGRLPHDCRRVRDARELERGVRHTGLIVRQVGLIIGKWKMRKIKDLEIVWLDAIQA